MESIARRAVVGVIGCGYLSWQLREGKMHDQEGAGGCGRGRGRGGGGGRCDGFDDDEAVDMELAHEEIGATVGDGTGRVAMQVNLLNSTQQVSAVNPLQE